MTGLLQAMRQGRHGTAARRGIRLHGSTAAAMQKIVIGGIDPSSFAETFDLETEIQSGSKHLDESGEGLTANIRMPADYILLVHLMFPISQPPAIEAEERRKILLRTHRTNSGLASQAGSALARGDRMPIYDLHGRSPESGLIFQVMRN